MEPASIFTFTEILGWIGNIGFIWGCIEMAKKHPIRSMTFNIIGNAFYIWFAIRVGTASLCIISLLLLLINCVGIYNWKWGKGQNKS